MFKYLQYEILLEKLLGGTCIAYLLVNIRLPYILYK